MITQKQMQMFAAQVGIRNVGFCEIEVILTHLLQLLGEAGLSPKLAFKGGTVLRKMFFGVNGRISTDLDFTLADDTDQEELFLELMGAFDKPYRGLRFTYPKGEKDCYINDGTISVNPLVAHEWNERGTQIKVQVSVREKPTMIVKSLPHLQQPYFQHLDFAPLDVPCLAADEILAEKIRASQQRAKIRDLYDLAEFANRPLNKDLIRRLAVIKVWQSHKGAGYSYPAFLEKISEKAGYDIADLEQLVRRDKRPNLDSMISKVKGFYGFLDMLTPEERELAADIKGDKKELYAQLKDSCLALA